MPSTDTFKLHWSRCLWVMGMWNQATQNEIDMLGTCNVSLGVDYVYISATHMTLNESDAS